LSVGGSAADKWIDEVLSPESVRKTGYFDYNAVTAAREKLIRTRPGRPGRTGLEMGLTAVVATQLWHHLYISGDLAELPTCRPELVEATAAA